MSSRYAVRHRLPAAAAVLACSLAASVGLAQSPSSGDGAAIDALQRAIVDAIAAAEKSVVAISRSAAMPAVPKQPAAGRNAAPNAFQRLEQLRQQRAGMPVQANPLASLQRVAPTLPPHAFGAGVVIGESAILTQYLVVKPGESHTVTTVEGETLAAEIAASDPRSGLAVLRVADSGATGLAPLPIGKAEDLRKGAFVVAIGNPFAIQSDGQPTTSWGTVANTARKAPAGENLNDVSDAEGSFRTTLHHFGSLIQTDARLGWNASGGALVTLGGELVGVTTTVATIAGHERPAGYAIPMNELMRRVVEELREGREPEYGLLGLTFDRNPALSPTSGEVGIAVTAAFRGGPAEKAGLRPGDLVLEIDGRRTVDADSLQLAVSSRAPGTEALVSFERNGSVMEASPRLGKAFVKGERVATERRPTWRGMRIDFPTAAPGEVLARVSQEGRLDPEGCVLVAEVEEGSSAWRSGVRPYVYISHIDGRRVSTPDEFYAAVDGVPESVNVRFTKPLTPPPAEPGPAVAGQAVPPEPAPAQQLPRALDAPLLDQRRRFFQDLEDMFDPFADEADE